MLEGVVELSSMQSGIPQDLSKAISVQVEYAQLSAIHLKVKPLEHLQVVDDDLVERGRGSDHNSGVCIVISRDVVG